MRFNVVEAAIVFDLRKRDGMRRDSTDRDVDHSQQRMMLFPMRATKPGIDLVSYLYLDQTGASKSIVLFDLMKHPLAGKLF